MAQGLPTKEEEVGKELLQSEKEILILSRE